MRSVRERARTGVAGVVAAGVAAAVALLPGAGLLPGAAAAAAPPVAPAAVDPAPLTYTYLDDGSGATVDGLTPAELPTAGGPMTVTGSGLGGVVDVLVGGRPAGDLVVADDRVTFTAPPADGEGGGAAPVTLLFAAGEVEAGLVTYVGPAVTGLSPAAGGTSGGDLVTITGTGLATATGVAFGDVVVGVERVDPAGTTVEVRTPPHPEGTVDVSVFLDGSDATLPGAWSYLDDGVQARVTEITPTTVPTAGGTTVTVLGSGLFGASGVAVGGTPSGDVVAAPDGTSVTFTVPPLDRPGTHPVVLVFGAGLRDAGTLTAVPPTLTGVDPAAGPDDGGTVVTLTGTALDRYEAVLVGDAAADVVAAATDGTWVQVRTPAHAPGRVDVTVLLPGVDAVAPASFTYRGDGGPGVLVSGTSPAHAPTSGGVPLTVVGAGLGDVTGVTVGGVPADGLDVAADGSLVSAVVPPSESAGPAAVVLQLPTGELPAGELVYAAPAVTAVSPPAGPAAGGTYLTLTGTGLAAVTAVTVGGAPAPVLDVAGDGTSVVVEAPLALPGVADVVVELPGADATLAGGYTYLADGTGTAVTRLEPAVLTTGGGRLTVVGSGLAGATGVTVGGVPATDVVAAPDGTSVSATVGAVATPGRVRVAVQFPAGSIPAGELLRVPRVGASLPTAPARPAQPRSPHPTVAPAPRPADAPGPGTR